MEFDGLIFNDLIKYFWCPHRWSHILKVEEQVVIKIREGPPFHNVSIAPASYGLWIEKRFFIVVKFYFLVIFFNINFFFKIVFQFLVFSVNMGVVIGGRWVDDHFNREELHKIECSAEMTKLAYLLLKYSWLMIKFV